MFSRVRADAHIAVKNHKVVGLGIFRRKKIQKTRRSFSEAQGKAKKNIRSEANTS